MKRKIFTLVFILFFIFTSSVFATDLLTLDERENSESKLIDSDLFINEDSYLLDGEIDGNVFVSSKDFVLLDTSLINGNLYITSNKVTLKSNVTYSDAISKDNNYSIDKINSHSTVNGNSFVICDEFILEPGSEIHGDLYVLANSIDIQKSSTIYGNLFAIGSDILINGKITNSVYATSKNFSMNYYGSIYNDLHLSSEKTILNSVIHRNAYIDSTEISTTSDFLLYGDLEANSDKFDFSGEIDGNAFIKSKELNFINLQEDSPVKCLIKGSLDYSSSEEINIEDSIVGGDINYSTYNENKHKSSFNLKWFILDLLTFVAYVLVIVLIFNLISKNYTGKTHGIKVSNTFAALGIGLLSIFAVIVLAILLILINIGTTLSFTLIFAYILILFLAIPLFVLDIAKLFKEKLNIYLIVSLISLALFLISKIPFVGAIVMFLFTMIGVGRIFVKLFDRKEN
ncbi:MAG: hypothetical protein ACI4VP_05195 [Clostridia bacterium]